MHLGRSVDQRERWQALQLHLRSARAAMEAGQRGEALKHTDAALALDPAFLAAQTLRERIVAMSAVPVAASMASPAAALTGSVEMTPALPFAPATVPDPAPRRHAPDLAQFEARARQRRLEKRVAAAQQGLAAGSLTDVRAAIEEIKELDPFNPALASLVEALDVAERERVAASVERELPRRTADDAPDLPLAIPMLATPIAPDLPLARADLTPAPEVVPPVEPLNDPIVISPVETRASIAIPVVPASADEVAAPEPPARTVQPSEPQPEAPHVTAAVMNAPRSVESSVSAEQAQDAAAPPRRRRARVIPWLAAAAAFAGVVFAAPWFQRSAPSDVGTHSAPVEVAVIAPPVVPTTGADAAPIDTPAVTAAPPPADGTPQHDVAAAPPPGPSSPVTAGAPLSSAAAPIGSMPSDGPLVRSGAVAPRPAAPLPAPADTVASVLPAVAAPAPPPPRPEPSPSIGNTQDMPRELAAAPIPAPPVAAAPRASSSSAAARITARPDDMQLVRDVLQRYRSAYQDLNAERARAIWPEVNEPALQRAFQALESQTLTFDACDVQLRGLSATAICRGSTEYVPKVGSREPRVEPRVWNFTLQKTGESWQIATARTQR